MDQLKTLKNDPKKAGQRASDKIIFGAYSRYALYAVHSRFDSVVWFVDDAEQLDCIVPGKPKVIRQELNWYDAIEGLWDGNFLTLTREASNLAKMVCDYLRTTECSTEYSID